MRMQNFNCSFNARMEDGRWKGFGRSHLLIATLGRIANGLRLSVNLNPNPNLYLGFSSCVVCGCVCETEVCVCMSLCSRRRV